MSIGFVLCKCISTAIYPLCNSISNSMLYPESTLIWLLWLFMNVNILNKSDTKYNAKLSLISEYRNVSMKVRLGEVNSTLHPLSHSFQCTGSSRSTFQNSGWKRKKNDQWQQNNTRYYLLQSTGGTSWRLGCNSCVCPHSQRRCCFSNQQHELQVSVSLSKGRSEQTLFSQYNV